MKKSQLRQIIKEEIKNVIHENESQLNEFNPRPYRNKLSKKQTFDMLEKYYNSIEIDGQKNAIDRIVRAKKSKYGYDVWYRIKDQGSDEGSTMSFVYFTDLKKKGLYDDKSINEGKDYKKGDEIYLKDVKDPVKLLIDMSRTRKDSNIHTSKGIFDIKVVDYDRMNESINEAKELTQDDIYNFLKPKFKDTKRATYEVDKEGKKVVVSWTITKKGYTDSKGDLFIDLEDMDFTDNHGGGKNWDTKAQLLSGLKKHIRDDAKSIFGENKQNNMENFNKLIKEALIPSFLKESQRQGWEEYRDIGYEIWHAAPHGYHAEAYPQFGSIINFRAHFDTYDEAVEHAELEIDGYLDDVHSSHYDDALDSEEIYEGLSSTIGRSNNLKSSLPYHLVTLGKRVSGLNIREMLVAQSYPNLDALEDKITSLLPDNEILYQGEDFNEATKAFDSFFTMYDNTEL